jgi:hypothetical protein
VTASPNPNANPSTHIVWIIVPHQRPRIRLARTNILVDLDRHYHSRPWRPTARHMSERCEGFIAIPQHLDIPTRLHCIRRPRLVLCQIPHILDSRWRSSVNRMRGPELESEFESFGDDIDGDDGLDVHIRRSENGGHPDGTTTIDGDRRVRFRFQSV